MKVHGTDMEVHGAEKRIADLEAQQEAQAEQLADAQKQAKVFERTCLEYVDSLALREAALANEKQKRKNVMRQLLSDHKMFCDNANKRIAVLEADVKRLDDRDGNATIQLAYETNDYPFNFDDCKIVDFGVSDNIYVIESPYLAERNKVIDLLAIHAGWCMRMPTEDAIKWATAKAQESAR